MSRLAIAGLLLLIGPALHGAPVPRPPKELPRDHLAGRWDYAYGNQTNGRMWLHADGSYASVHEPGAATIFHGHWRVDGTALELQEWAYWPGSGSESGPRTYRFDFSRGLGAGTCEGVAVRLTNRVPID